jgi:predicted nucleic acid-binding protein
MPKVRIFFDSSALFAGILSSGGAARALLVLSEMGRIELLVSEQVIVETERSLARKTPIALPEFRQAARDAELKILKGPSAKAVRKCLRMISDPSDAPILAAAIEAKVDYLVTHNRKHFLDDPKVMEKSGLRIGAPGDALAWLREQREV